MASTEWETLSHAEFTAELSAGLEERERRLQELYVLTGQQPAVATAPERRGPGRPPKTRAEQLEAAAAAESAGVQ